MKETNNSSKSTKRIVIGVGIAVIVVALLAVVYAVFGAKPVAGAKSITIEVVDDAAKSVVYDVQTDAEYLQQAMEDAEGLKFDGEAGDYGMMVDTINGVTAEYDKNGAYWSFYVNGEYCNYGIDAQPVLDGDAFRIVYTTDQVE